MTDPLFEQVLSWTLTALFPGILPLMPFLCLYKQLFNAITVASNWNPRILFHRLHLLPYECVWFLQMFSVQGCLHVAFSQFLLYAHVPTFTRNDDSSVQVCPLLVPQCHWRWVCFGFTLSTLYSNIQEPFLQWAVLVFIHLFSVTDVRPRSTCSLVTRAHQIQSVSLLSLL